MATTVDHFTPLALRVRGNNTKTALVKGSVARGQALPPEARMIKYASGSAVHHIEIMVEASGVISPS